MDHFHSETCVARVRNIFILLTMQPDIAYERWSEKEEDESKPNSVALSSKTNEQDTSRNARVQNDVAIFSGLAIFENSNALIASHSNATRD